MTFVTLFQSRRSTMGHPCCPLFCVDCCPDGVLYDSTLLLVKGDKEVPQETVQRGQQGGLGGRH